MEQSGGPGKYEDLIPNSNTGVDFLTPPLLLPFSQVADVGCAVHLCSLLHCRYGDFSSYLLEQMQRIYSTGIGRDEDKVQFVTTSPPPPTRSPPTSVSPKCDSHVTLT